jgi:acyl carrier protein
MVGQSWDEFSIALAAKVAGGRHLHELTAGRQLEFFVLCSSVAAVIGSLGQANYTAANSFLDGLAHYRRGLGLPALSVNWGPWAASGMAAQLTALERQREGALNAFRPIDAGEALDWMQGAVNGGLAQRVYAPVDWALLFERAPVLRGRPLLAGFVEPVLSRPQPVRAPVSLTLLDSLARLPMGERRDYLYAFTREQAAAVLHIKPAEQIGPEQPLSALGMDSLMALDLARSLGEAVGHKLSPTLLFNHSTVEALTDHLAELLAIRPEAAQAQQPVDVDEQWAQQALAEIRGLSDEELNRMLESELSELLDGS